MKELLCTAQQTKEKAEDMLLIPEMKPFYRELIKMIVETRCIINNLKRAQ